MLAAREGRADVVKTFLEQKDIDVNIQLLLYWQFNLNSALMTTLSVGNVILLLSQKYSHLN